MVCRVVERTVVDTRRGGGGRDYRWTINLDLKQPRDLAAISWGPGQAVTSGYGPWEE